MSRSAWDARGYGRRAFAISLTLHAAALTWAVLATGPMRPDAAHDWPPGIEIVEEGAGEASEFHLVERPGPPSGGTKAPNEVGVAVAAENIVPSAPVAPHSPPGHHSSVSPAAEIIGAGQGAGEPGAGGPGGGLFAGAGKARSVVYVIDRSSSMGLGGRLAAAARELLTSLKRLPETARFQIVVYHDMADFLMPGRRELLPATAENVRSAAERLANLPAEGGTRHLPALKLALSLGAEVVYFLTDADDLSDADRREATGLNRGRAVIHTIELTTAHRGRSDMPLQALARDNRGRYLAIDLSQRRQGAKEVD